VNQLRRGEETTFDITPGGWGFVGGSMGESSVWGVGRIKRGSVECIQRCRGVEQNIQKNAVKRGFRAGKGKKKKTTGPLSKTAYRKGGKKT